MANIDLATGASKSLKKTIDEVMNFLGNQETQPTSGLRDFLNEKLADLAERWYRRGFNRGHRESAQQLAKGKVPKILTCDATREFFKGGKRKVNLKSTLKGE